MRHGATGMNRRATGGCCDAGVVNDQVAEALALALSLATTRQKYSAPGLSVPGV